MTNEKLSNWGRWGPDDQIGVLNLLQNSSSVLEAIKLVKKGDVYSLAVPLEKDGPQFPLFHKTWRVSHWQHLHDPDLDIIDDVIAMETHSGSHIDGLGHSWHDGQFYNGFSSDKYASSRGVERLGIENVKHIFGRGVMLDVPAYKGVDHLGPTEPVTADDLDRVAEAQGIEFKPGDVVLVRTGWYRLFYSDRERWSQSFPGPDGSVLAWLKKHDVVAIGTDHPACERYENIEDPVDTPLHRHGLRDLGVYLLENLDLEELARDKVYEFLFVGTPLRITHGTGSPWNPLAIA